MTSRIRWEILVRNLLVFTGLWVLLTEGDLHQLWLGLGFALLSAVTTSWPLISRDSRRWPRPRALLNYLTYFFHHSLMGGIDVAKRALRIDRNVRPIYVNYPLRIPPDFEGARILFAISICLFPGSLSCEFRKDILFIQILDEELGNLEPLHELEERVAALFSLALPRPNSKSHTGEKA